LKDDPLNCSACNAACPNVAHGTAGCSNSVCGIGSCDQGYDDCDKKLSTGCEADLNNDKLNCSVCGKSSAKRWSS
ncbi:hypothetical protein KJ567_00740, partial [Candidatus Bipolaricaulota bacterium]|nr:hypothetical protein [Candidatus Bipolaricaulota bacterium]